MTESDRGAQEVGQEHAACCSTRESSPVAGGHNAFLDNNPDRYPLLLEPQEKGVHAAGDWR
jgi:hypothetical protein